MLEELKDAVWKANLDLARSGLITLTFGNVSGIDRRRGLMAIKPSGVAYDALKVDDIVCVDLEGRVIEGWLAPSTDSPTHLELYKAFPMIGGIAHAHSRYATTFAQARKEIPCFGTTHADRFHGPVPVTRQLTETEVSEDYERWAGRVIIECVPVERCLEIPAALVAGHGPFTWGETPREAVETGVILEQVAEMALGTLFLSRRRAPLEPHIRDKHFRRKHGPDAYYGQKKGGRT